MIARKTQPCNHAFRVEGSLENAGRIASRVKTILQGLKIPAEIVRRVAIVTYEAEMNICSYARDGRIILTVTPEEITIDAIDKGQGIPDIEMAMREGYSTATEEIWQMGFGAGMGLSNIKHFSDVFEITSEVGKGTHLMMKIYTGKARKSASH